MTWSASLVETIVGRDNHYESVISLSNGTANFMERFVHSGSTAVLRQSVIAWTRAFDERQIALAALASGLTVDCTPDPDPPPDPVIQSQLTYLNRWNLYQSGIRALNAGLPVSASSISQLQNFLIASFQTAYLPYL